MKKTIDMMAQLLEKNNIPLPEASRKEDGGSSSDNKETFHALVVGGSSSDNKETCHALVVGSSSSSSFIIDSGASRNMASMQDSFSAMYPYNGPSILMGDDSKIQAKGIGRIDIEDGYFNNVLFVPDLATNLLSVYQMTHCGEAKRVTFTPNVVEISEISIGQVVVVGYTDHDSRM